MMKPHLRLTLCTGLMAFFLVAGVATAQGPSAATAQRLPLNLALLNSRGALAISGTPSMHGGFLPGMDRRLDTLYEARSAGPVEWVMVFAREQRLDRFRVLTPDEATVEWTLADSEEALARGEGRRLVEPQAATLRTAEALPAGWRLETRLETPAAARVIKLRLIPAQPQQRLRIVELGMEGEQVLDGIAVEHRSHVVQVGRATPLHVVGVYSGGETRPLRAGEARFVVEPSLFARVNRHGVLTATRRGAIRVRAELGVLRSVPLPLEIVDAD